MRFLGLTSPIIFALFLNAWPLSAEQGSVPNEPCTGTSSASGWEKFLRVYRRGEEVILERRLDHPATGLGFSVSLQSGEQPRVDGPNIDAIMQSKSVQENLKGLSTSQSSLVTDVFHGELTVLIDSLDGGPQWTMRGKLERTSIYYAPESRRVVSYDIVDRLPGTGNVRQVLRNLEQGGEFRIAITITTGPSSMRTLFSQRFDSDGFAELATSRSEAEEQVIRNCPLLR